MQPHTTRVIATCKDVRAAVDEARRRGERVGLVPTMGALHEGHLSLVRAAQLDCQFVIVTIFVNPAQFGPQEDLQHYPRTLSQDVSALDALGADVVFVPAINEIYPPGFSTFVEPPEVAQLWEGECRPGHFRGVTTVVLKLFHLVPADVAFFGEKDFQQVQVIRRMVDDLNLAIRIKTCPTVREPDGLAMSSRNRYLEDSERESALSLSRALAVARQLVADGQRDPEPVLHRMRQILSDGGIDRIDYVALVDPETLRTVRQIRGPTQALIAAYVGKTRLIDNCRL